MNRVVKFGLIAGVMVGVPLFVITVTMKGHLGGTLGMVVGYLTMLIALSMVFIAVNRQRDIENGGEIKFWPAFGMGLGISIIAGILYVAAWEAVLAFTHMDFAGDYAREAIAKAQAKGVNGEALTKLKTEMDQFKQAYSNPVMRYGESFTEIFPVGVLVSLISAILLRNPRFMPARD